MEWWADFARRAKPRKNYESGNNLVAPKGATPMFPSFPLFFVPRLNHLLVIDGLNVFRPRATKNIVYAWLSHATAYLYDLMVVYLIYARLATVTRREGYVSWGVYNIFLTPVNDWIHNFIRDWTREWDSALNTSAV